MRPAHEGPSCFFKNFLNSLKKVPKNHEGVPLKYLTFTASVPLVKLSWQDILKVPASLLKLKRAPQGPFQKRPF